MDGSVPERFTTLSLRGQKHHSIGSEVTSAFQDRPKCSGYHGTGVTLQLGQFVPSHSLAWDKLSHLAVLAAVTLLATPRQDVGIAKVGRVYGQMVIS